jgi:cell division protein FtsL
MVMGRVYDMAGEFRFARNGIHNTPVREVDRAGHRRMWGSAVVVVLFAGLVLLSVGLRMEQRDLGYQIEELQRQRAAAESARRHLHLELETLRSPRRIEALATTQLRLVEPSETDAFVIERVNTAPAPSSAVVARR